MKSGKPAEFRTPAIFRSWLAENHSTASELLVRLYRVHAADRGITYAQALDEALCYGWIDGVRRTFDKDSFTVRFSPRRAKSIWSRMNVAHVKRLTATGRMAKPGIAAYEARDNKRTGVYSFERRPSRLSPRLGKRFRSDVKAWEFFRGRPPWYQRVSIFWVMSAKQEKTREKRLGVLMECSGRGKPIPALAREKKTP